jgi:hypothetical protein
VGTPEVAEFAAAELGARMRMGSWSARCYLADALDVRHRLPLIWARVRAREARVGNVRLVAARTRHLSVEAAAAVDAAMVAFVDGSVPWGRFESRLDGRVVAADPQVAAAREAARAREQFAKRTRSSEDGTAGFYVRSSVGVIARVEATVAFVAEALAAFEDPATRVDLDLRRVRAVLVLCNPTRAVELLAAYAALRSRSLGSRTDIDLGPQAGSEPHVDPPPEAQPTTDDPVRPSGLDRDLGDPLTRMDAFARRVGFTPTHLPAWLTLHIPACRCTSDGPPETGPPGLGATAPPGAADLPRFGFDWSRLLPVVRLHLHVAAETVEDEQGGVVRWEGEGPVTLAYLLEHLAPLHRASIEPVLDLAGQAPVDSYEIPDRHRRAVRLRTPADCFPFSSDLSPAMDIDHTHPHRSTSTPAPAQRSDDTDTGSPVAGPPEYASRLDNYGPLGRFHHRVKTFGCWVVRQPFAGSYLWRDPHGQIYLVDHSGTRKVTGRDQPARPPTTPPAPTLVRAPGSGRPRLQPGTPVEIRADQAVPADDRHLVGVAGPVRVLTTQDGAGGDQAALVDDDPVEPGTGTDHRVGEDHAVAHERAPLDDDTGPQHAADHLTADPGAR